MRIDVADPGSERLALVAALVTAGYEVRAIELRDLFETRADLVVIAGDAQGALDALRMLRDDGARPDVPVVLVGTPEGTDPMANGPGFGAEHVLARPVDEEKLVSAVRELLRPRPEASAQERAPELTLELAQRERTSAWRTGADENEAPERDDPSGVSAIHPMNARDEEAEESAGRPSSPEPIVTGAVRASERSPRPRSVPPPPTGISVVERRDRASEMPATSTPISIAGFASPGTGPGTGTGSELVPSAPISDALRTLLAAADRRVFPSLPALDVSIPAGEASAAELVPDEFLDDAPVAELEPEDEGLFLPALPPVGWASAAGALSGMPPTASMIHADEPDASGRSARTGGVEAASRSVISRTPEPEDPAKKTAPGTPASMSQRPPRPPPTLLTGTAAGAARAASSIAAGSFSELPSVSRRGELSATLPDDGSLGASLTDGTRRLALAPAGMLRALLALVLHRGTARVEVWLPRATDPFATLSFVRGELVAVDGPLQQEALHLARSPLGTVATPRPTSRAEEEAARERLAVMLERRELSIASSALLAAAAERSLLARLVALDEGEARFQPTPERDAAPRLGRTGPRLVELARGLDASALARVAGEGVVLAPSRSFDAICEALEVPPEVVALFGRATDGVASSDLARAALVVPGLPGIVLSLFVSRALTALSREADGGLDARAAEALVREHAARAEDADYFALLGVARDANDAAIRAAKEGRTSMLASLPLDALGLGALTTARRAAIDAIEEAASALASPRLRAQYAAAIGTPG